VIVARLLGNLYEIGSTVVKTSPKTQSIIEGLNNKAMLKHG
jgi:hypothetical protein